MLSHEDNEMLVRVGAGTGMGEFFRLFWIPFLLSKDLLAGGRPRRVRLLGEDLVAFRASDNTIGLLDHACAHRGAPLAFARNEECGLRCVYHGWKFDIAGRVTDMPAEPERSRFKDNVRLKAYPCRERNGVVWTYMGPEKDNLPPLPNFEWNLVSPEQVHLSLRVQECNWLQALEGDIDSAHAAFLHGRIDQQGRMKRMLYVRDRRPTFDVMRQEFGLSIAARRVLEDGPIYWRVNQFVLPFYTLTPPQSSFPELTGHAWVPIDDENTLVLMFSYHPNEPLYEKTRRLFEEGYKGRESGHPSHGALRGDDAGPHAGGRRRFTRENDFKLDYESQRTAKFREFWAMGQDAACQSGLGPIFTTAARGRLGVSDSGIVMARACCWRPRRRNFASTAKFRRSRAIPICRWCAPSRCN
jgi:phenylpropionate dioxygenase-like ring-hydroxylating dioxygenase large terminal subunit